jgi:hypothetical protein
MTFSFSRFRDHTQRRATVGRTASGRVISSSQRPLPDNTQRTNIHAPGGIRTLNLNRRAAEDLRLRPRGHWDPYMYIYYIIISVASYMFRPPIVAIFRKGARYSIVVSVAREVTINALRRDEYRGLSRAEAMSVSFGVCLSTTVQQRTTNRSLLMQDSRIQVCRPRR